MPAHCRCRQVMRLESVARLSGWSVIITRLARRQLTTSSLNRQQQYYNLPHKKNQYLFAIFLNFFRLFFDKKSRKPCICLSLPARPRNTPPGVSIKIWNHNFFVRNPWKIQHFCPQTRHSPCFSAVKSIHAPQRIYIPWSICTKFRPFPVRHSLFFFRSCS